VNKPLNEHIHHSLSGLIKTTLRDGEISLEIALFTLH